MRLFRCTCSHILDPLNPQEDRIVRTDRPGHFVAEVNCPICGMYLGEMEGDCQESAEFFSAIKIAEVDEEGGVIDPRLEVR